MSNFPANSYEMSNISGDGSRATTGAASEGGPTTIWNLSSNTIVDTIDDASYAILDNDGSRIAFYSSANLAGQNADGSDEIYLWDSGTITQITNLSGSVIVSPPDISADGTKIVFSVQSGSANSLYIWQEGTGLELLVEESSQASAVTHVRMSSDGTAAVFLHDGNLTGNDSGEDGAFYRINLASSTITHLLNISANDYPLEYFVIDGDASHLAFHSSQNFNSLNPSHGFRLWVWNSTTGIQMISAGSGTPSFPYLIPLGFSDDASRLLFQSSYNHTGENPDGSFEYYIYQSSTIRQLSSKTGIPMPMPGTDGLSANGQSAAMLLPTGTDYTLDDFNFLNDIELFEADCDGTSGNPSFDAPTNLRSTSLGQTSIALAWNDNATEETSYRLERSINGGTSWTEIANLGANVISYSNSSLTCNTSYQYRVRAYRSSDSSYTAYSNTLTVTTAACGNFLAAPSNLRSTSISETSIILAWDDNASNETEYRIQRNHDSITNWPPIATVTANTTSHTDFNVACNTTYQYRIRGYRSSDMTYSDYSYSINITTPACSVPLIAPSNLVKTAMSSSSISIAWQDNATDEATYNIERSLDGINWSFIAGTYANVTSYTANITNCTPDYYFRVRAWRSDGAFSDYSPVLVADCRPAPASNLSTSNLRSQSLTLNWTDNASNELNYRIRYSLDESNWNTYAHLSANVINYAIAGLNCDTSYFFKVLPYPYNANMEEAAEVLNVTTRPCSLNVPSDFVTIGRDLSSVTIGWSDSNDGETAYYLERYIYTTGGDSWQEIAVVSAETLSYTITGLDCSSSIQLRLRTYRSTDDNFSPYSDGFYARNQLCTPNLTLNSIGSNRIYLNWNSSYHTTIERSLDGINWTELNHINKNSYTDNTVVCETTYYYRVKVDLLSGSEHLYSDYSNVVSATTLSCVLPAPTNLSITNADYTKVYLAWQDNASDNSATYLESSLDGVNWTTSQILAANATAGFIIPAQCNTLYYFRVRAYRSVDNLYSEASNVITGQTSGCLPTTPTNLRTTSTALTSISLAWDDNASDESSYVIYRNNVYLTTLPANTTSYTDTGLNCRSVYNSPYTYTVKAYRNTDDIYSFASNQLITYTNPCPPSNLRRVANAIVWDDNLNFEQAYQVYRSSDGGSTWTYIGNGRDSTSYRDDNMTCGVQYQYRVRAALGVEFTDYSNVLAFMSHCNLPVPSNLVSTSITTTSITLSWTDNSSDESNFELFRSSDGGTTWTVIANVDANVTSYIDSGLNCNKSYRYNIRAYRSSDNFYSQYWTPLTISTNACPTLQMPTSLRRVTSTQSSITLAWYDNTIYETGYRIEHSSNGGTSWTEIASLAANTTSYVHTGLICNTNNQYRVRAYRSPENVYSFYSSVLTAATLACPPVLAPDSLRRQDLSRTSVSLLWDDNATDETSYSLERSANAGLSWTEIASLGANSTSYTDSSLTCGTAYRYRVRAHRSSNNTWSAYANILAVMTHHCAFVAPTNLRTSNIAMNSIALAWDDNSTVESNYRIERSINGGASWVQIATVAANVSSYTNIGLVCNTNYQYRVRAYRSADASFSAYTSLAVTTALCPPLAPSVLRAAHIGATNITLAWVDNATDETAYNVIRRVDTVNWVNVGNLAANTTSFTLSGLTCNTSYIYAVTAYRNSGPQPESVKSNILTVRTGPCINKPLNLSIDFNGSAAVLSWLDNSVDERDYRVERSLNGGAFVQIAVLGIDASSYTDAGRSCGENLRYRVRSQRLGLYSAYSDIVSLDCNRPAAPSNLSMTLSNHFPILTWTDNAVNETHYFVEISVDGGLTWARQHQILSNQTSFTHEYPDCEKTYSYRIRAFNYYSNNYSNPSNMIQWAAPVCVRPVNGALMTLTRTTTSDARLAFSRTNPLADYLIQASVDNGQSWFAVTTLDAQTAPAPYIYTVQCGLTYRFRMIELFDSGRFDYSTELAFAPKTCPLSRPAGITHTQQGTVALIRWNRNPETGNILHTLERRVLGTTTWESVHTATLGTSPNYTYTAELNCDTIYDYRVTASRNGQLSAPSLPLRVVAASCASLPAPSNLSFNDLGDGQIELGWTDNSSNETEFTLVVQATDVYHIPANSTSFTLVPSACEETLEYSLRAYNAASNSYSMRIIGSFSIACSSLAALNLNASVQADSSVRLEWNDVLSSTGEYVLYQVDASGASSQYNLDETTTSLSIENLECGQNYDFQLRARRESDDSSVLSNPVDFSLSACAESASVLALFNNGLWSFASSDTLENPSSLTLADASWQPLIGDWNGDGTDGIGLYRNGTFILRSAIEGSVQENSFSFMPEISGQAVVGDWNGDGVESIGIFANGEFILSNDNATIHYRFNLGDASGWNAVAGDWNGDNADGIGLYKEGMWHLVDDLLNPVSQTIAYGPEQAGWLPIIGDWNNDSIDTIGLYNSGMWRLRLSSNIEGEELNFLFGAAGDMPLGSIKGAIPGLEYAGALPAITLTPTPEITAEVTSEATEEATATPSPEPTAEATAEAPVATPTPEAEITPEATAEN